MFSANSSRFATFGVISKVPGDIIDTIWGIIDNNLQGVFPLQNLLKFDLIDNNGKLQVHFTEEGLNTEMAFDEDFVYSDSFPKAVIAYDDGSAQTILLPEEAEQE
ncbi:DUF960 domain-containing protein [Lacticaseibacillus zhaodongensis]|uniref:DUF960 domain-containing protein n=1 Tax=Lacticaseibacillus zhaodongensis TaxID=2668065 RepID=UPI0012D2C4C8|nr:DUF960 domain-containing protein [Lacticaseibacillus zhaodongensis]